MTANFGDPSREPGSSYRCGRDPDREFIGYIFRGPPEREPRMWFLDRHIRQFVHAARYGYSYGADVGVWAINVPDYRLDNLVGLILRHEYPDGTVIVWKLTDTTIPFVHTFGRSDDVWRLGIWPD